MQLRRPSRGWLGALAILAAALSPDAALAATRAAFDAIYEPHSAVHRYFYVRGNVGVARHGFSSFSQAELAGNKGSILTSSIDDATTVSAGIGVKFSQRFRMDLTGEYRGSAQVRTLDNVTATLTSSAGQLQANTAYPGSMTSYLGLLNRYWDLYALRGVTPYVGAGIGLARALLAGASFDLSARSKLDIGYRYLDMGSGVALATGRIDCACGTAGSPLKVSDLHAHDFRGGIRLALSAPQEVHRPMK